MSLILTKKLAFVALTCLLTSKDEINIQDAKKSIINHYQQYQAEKDFGVKKTSFEISDNGFVRYKRTTTENKTEYYSVKLDKIQEVIYLGNEKTGWLILKCMESSIIFQTYQDANGNIDEMVNEIKIPIKNIDVVELNKWVNDINILKSTKI